MGSKMDIASSADLPRDAVEHGHDRRGLRPREIARQLGVTPSVVYEAFYRGEFKRVWRFGRAIVIPAEEVDRWLATKSA
jgi:excisionase family DNA binding protein